MAAVVEEHEVREGAGRTSGLEMPAIDGVVALGRAELGSNAWRGPSPSVRSTTGRSLWVWVRSSRAMVVVWAAWMRRRGCRSRAPARRRRWGTPGRFETGSFGGDEPGLWPWGRTTETDAGDERTNAEQSSWGGREVAGGGEDDDAGGGWRAMKDGVVIARVSRGVGSECRYFTPAAHDGFRRVRGAGGVQEGRKRRKQRDRGRGE